MKWIATRPLYSIILLIIVVAAITPYHSTLESRYEVEDFFPESTEIRQQFDDYKDLFGRDDRSAILLIESNNRFTRNDFQNLIVLEERLSTEPEIDEIHSPATTKLPLRDANDQLKLMPAFEQKHFNF